MSEDEKNAQIGVAVSEYQAAKAEVGQVEKKVENVFLAYRAAGALVDPHHGITPHGGPTIEEGKEEKPPRVRFGYESVDASLLLNEGDLIVLIRERDAARSRLAKAKQTMNTLGITGVS